MRPVLNLPMPPHEREQPHGIGALRCQTRDTSDDLLSHFTRFGEDYLALHLKDLGEARPSTIPCQHGTGLQPPLFDTPVAIVHRGSDRARFSGYGGVGKNGLNIFKGTGSVSCYSAFVLHLGRFLNQEELMEREAMVQNPSSHCRDSTGCKVHTDEIMYNPIDI